MKHLNKLTEGLIWTCWSIEAGQHRGRSMNELASHAEPELGNRDGRSLILSLSVSPLSVRECFPPQLPDRQLGVSSHPS